jgi:hypothetical protein
MQAGQQEAGIPFLQLLKDEGLPKSLRDVILYALACLPSNQESAKHHDFDNKAPDSGAGQNEAPGESVGSVRDAWGEANSSPANQESAVGGIPAGQESAQCCEMFASQQQADKSGLVSTSEGMTALSRYMESVGRCEWCNPCLKPSAARMFWAAPRVDRSARSL